MIHEQRDLAVKNLIRLKDMLIEHQHVRGIVLHVKLQEYMTEQRALPQEQRGRNKPTADGCEQSRSEFIKELNDIIQKLSKDNRTSKDLSKEEAETIAATYKSIAGKAAALIPKTIVFFNSPFTSAAVWNAQVGTEGAALMAAAHSLRLPIPLIFITPAEGSNRNNNNNVAEELSEDRTLDTTIKISNALLFVNALTMHISNHRDEEGMLRVGGSQTEVTDIINKFKQTSGLPVDAPETRERSSSFWSRADKAHSPKPTLLTAVQLEKILGSKNSHVFTSIIKKIASDDSCLGLEKPIIPADIQSKTLAVAIYFSNSVNQDKVAQDLLDTILYSMRAHEIHLFHCLIRVMHHVADPEVDNRMNDDNVTLAFPALFTITGIHDTSKIEDSLAGQTQLGKEKVALARLASHWLKHLDNTNKTFNDALKTKHNEGDDSDMIHVDLDSVKKAVQEQGGKNMLGRK